MLAQEISDARRVLSEARTLLDQVNNTLSAMAAIAGDFSVPPTVPVFPAQSDPRTPNAREHRKGADGTVEAVWLSVFPTPGARYHCAHVDVIGEREAQGRTIAYVSVGDRKGQRATPRVVLATGYQGDPTRFDSFLPVKFDKDPIEIPITTKFDLPNLGPLAILILDDEDRIISDVVASLGLPGGRHIGFVASWVEV